MLVGVLAALVAVAVVGKCSAVQSRSVVGRRARAGQRSRSVEAGDRWDRRTIGSLFVEVGVIGSRSVVAVAGIHLFGNHLAGSLSAEVAAAVVAVQDIHSSAEADNQYAAVLVPEAGSR